MKQAPAQPPCLETEPLLGYEFKDPELLATALTHRSFGPCHNERLEYLGDALLDLIIAEALFFRFPQAAESDLSRLRANLVNNEQLAQLARRLKLGHRIRLGAGEHKSGGSYKDSLLGDAVEALFGAVYLDSDLEQCRALVLGLYAHLLEGLTLSNVPKDPKSKLQEYLQAKGSPLPSYKLVAEQGKAHTRLFTVQCHIPGLAEPILARGRSKRIAEQRAADAALELLSANAANS